MLTTNSQAIGDMLVVFDMDHTMVGDLVSLSDRDNIETNVPWSTWPAEKEQGLSPDFILPYLHVRFLCRICTRTNFDVPARDFPLSYLHIALFSRTCT